MVNLAIPAEHVTCIATGLLSSTNTVVLYFSLNSDDVPKSIGTRCSKSIDDGVRNKEQHERKSRGWVCNHYNLRKLIINRCGEVVTHVTIVACPSSAFVFRPLIPSSPLLPVCCIRFYAIWYIMYAVVFHVCAPLTFLLAVM